MSVMSNDYVNYNTDPFAELDFLSTFEAQEPESIEIPDYFNLPKDESIDFLGKLRSYSKTKQKEDPIKKSPFYLGIQTTQKDDQKDDQNTEADKPQFINPFETPIGNSVEQLAQEQRNSLQSPTQRAVTFNYAKANTNERAKYIMNRLQKELGLTVYQAAGVVGNLHVESNYNDEVFNINAVGDNGRAIGIGQWHPDRRKGVDLSTFEKQVDHLIWELQNEDTWNKYGGLNRLKQAKTAKEAAQIIDRYFERSSGAHLAKRQYWANHYNRIFS